MFACSDSNRNLRIAKNKLLEIRIAKLETTKIISSASNDKKVNTTKYNSLEQDKSHRLKLKNIFSEPDKSNNLKSEAYTFYEGGSEAAELKATKLCEGDMSLKPCAKKCSKKEYCFVASNATPIQKRPVFCGIIHHQIQLIVGFIFTPPPWKPPD